MKLALYCRVSTEEQADHGQSLEEQETRLKAWALAMGHMVVAVYTERGVSGSVPPRLRPAASAMFSDLEAGRVDGIAFVSLDRMSRDLGDTLLLIEEAHEKGWSLVSLKESLDTSTAAGLLCVHILAAMHQFVRDSIGERTKAALKHRKDEGRVYGNIPWGMQRGPTNELLPAPKERDILRETQRLRGMGWLPTEIAHHMQHCDARNPRTGRPVDAALVRRLLALDKKEPQ